MFSRLYAAITSARNSLYEKGVFKAFSLGVPVISIGNITVGGTGKTPLVALTAEFLAANGEKVCILTRGYGRENPRKRVIVSDGERILADSRQAGDEPFELARKLLGKAIIIADVNRVSAGNWAREKFGITIFVLDDAFQHQKVKRDLDIVCVDATNPFGNGKTLPSGILRESLENLRRAGAIVITRSNLAENISNLRSEILKYNRNCPIFVSENKIVNLIELMVFHLRTRESESPNKSQISTIQEQNSNREKHSLAFCALGNPNNFFKQLRQENFQLASTQTFPDHYFYKQTDAEKLSEKAKKIGAEILLTTAKDAVKLKDLKFDVPCYVVESEMIFDDKTDFDKLLLKVRNKN